VRGLEKLGFYALVAQLERLSPGAARVGGDGPVEQEAIRFRHDPGLIFQSADVTAMSESPGPGGAPRFELTTAFLGLTGASSPLPSYVAEEIVQSEPHSLRAEFLDLFHHRLLSLLYRAHAKYSLATEATSAGNDAWIDRLLALAGIDPEVPPALPRVLLARLAPLLVCARRSAWGLERALEIVLGPDSPGLSAAVTPFTGGWEPIEARDRLRLGRANHQLGVNAVLGSRVLDRSGQFTVRLGPLGSEAYQRLLRGGDLHARAQAVLELFNTEGAEGLLELQLARHAPPRFKLSRGGPARLGLDTWLGTPSGDPQLTVSASTFAS
jgi:type VI secretion system protein ImpH